MSIAMVIYNVGLHECIESTTVFHVLSKYRSIQVRTILLLLIVGFNFFDISLTYVSVVQ